MAEARREDVQKIETAVSSFRNRAGMYADLSANLRDRKVNSSLRYLNRSSAPGKQMGRIGWALFIIPEPTMISSIVGLQMVGLGKVMERYYAGTTIKDVGAEARKTMRELENIFG